MNQTVCYIALGSNTDRESHLKKAQELLREVYPEIHFAPEEETHPLGMHNPALFLNQVAVITTQESMEELKSKLKNIEESCANPPKNKLLEEIRIDVDLLTYGETILKKEDYQRDYIQRGIETLRELKSTR